MRADFCPSYDVFVQDLPIDLRRFADIPSAFQRKPLPARNEIVKIILEFVPAADVSESEWVYIRAPTVHIDVWISTKDPLMAFTFQVRSGNGSDALVARILERLRLRGLDFSSGSDNGFFAPLSGEERWSRHCKATGLPAPNTALLRIGAVAVSTAIDSTTRATRD
jgi:hypothetical protein